MSPKCRRDVAHIKPLGLLGLGHFFSQFGTRHLKGGVVVGPLDVGIFLRKIPLKISHVPKILTPNFHHDIIILLKSSRKLSITKTPLAATKGVFLYLLKALRLDYLSPLFRHLRISHSAISSATTLTNNGSKTSSRKLYSITSHLPLAQYSECDCLIISRPLALFHGLFDNK